MRDLYADIEVEVVFNGGFRVLGVDSDRSKNETFIDYSFTNRKGELIYSLAKVALPTDISEVMKREGPLKELGESTGALSNEKYFENIDPKNLSSKKTILASNLFS